MSGAAVNEPAWRCVVTGVEPDGREVVRQDRPLAGGATDGTWSGPVLVVEGWPRSLDDGDPTVDADATVPGSIAVIAVAVEAGSGWSAGDRSRADSTLTAYLVLTGRLVVEVGDLESTLGPGDVFLPRDQPHRVRSAGDDQARIVVARFTPEPDTPSSEPFELRAVSGPAKRVRRVVAGVDESGRPAFVHDGDPGLGFALGDESQPDVALSDIWELGGVPTSSVHGGDAPEPFGLEPRAFGAKLLCTELKPPDPAAAALEGWHTTATIDVDVIVDGAVDLHLPDSPVVSLVPGDIVVQRGTDHRWAPTGDRQLRMLTIMIGVESAVGRSSGH